MTLKKTKWVIAGSAMLAATLATTGLAEASSRTRHDIDDLAAIADRAHANRAIQARVEAPGRVGDTCADNDSFTLWLRHEVHLQWWTTMEPVGPKGDGWDLTFDFCTLQDESVPTLGLPLSDLHQRARDGIDHFVGVLQKHYETRGNSYESALTDCFDEVGGINNVPDDLDGSTIPADDPDLDWLPIIGYDLAFTQDPKISIMLYDMSDGKLGGAIPRPFPTDPQPAADRNEFFMDFTMFTHHTAEFFAKTVAHELAHRIGYIHGEVEDLDNYESFIFAVGACFGSPDGQAPFQPGPPLSA